MSPEISHPTTTWRLIKTPPARGAWNMAVDEAILAAVGEQRVLPTLRFYAWNSPCLSLGYAQPFFDVDLDKTQQLGWEIVRRATGGRAILHTDELTYAVIGPHEEPRLAGGVLESYRRLSQALLAGLQNLALPVAAIPKSAAEKTRKPEPVCFEVPSNYEITILGKKLVGSAQARKKSGVIQHGTLPLQGDLTRITQALQFADEADRQTAAQRLLGRATTFETALGQIISWEQAAASLAASFSKTLQLDLLETDLTDWEIAKAEQLVKEKYAHPDWTERI